MKTVSALAPWYGSNRLLAEQVGKALGDCKWVGVPFAGGMCELPFIKARTVVVNDQHRFVINLARTVADDDLRPALIANLRKTIFHPDELDQNQEWCKVFRPYQSEPPTKPDLQAAYSYFITCWMGRSHIAGTQDEFHGQLSTRWNASGGDSVVRYRSAIKALAKFAQTARRCTFNTTDAFEFIPRCEDTVGHGIYADPPFPMAGRRYRHNSGKTDEEEKAWHRKLRDQLQRFMKTIVVCRFYDHPLIRELYPPALWEWKRLTGGKKQSNDAAPEVLVISQKVEMTLTDWSEQ